MSADYEQLGKFYLGKEYSLQDKELLEPLVLYDSQDLTTHAMIVGMTGSGKTGLGMALLEEALMDNIPVIAIDPKGDLANLLLTFEELTADQFYPWVDAQAAATEGLSLDDYAQVQAQMWQNGLSQWGQDAARIRQLRRQVEMVVYTPGSSAGRSVSVLRSFDVPPRAVMAEGDLRREHLQTTVTSLLSLLGIGADPVTSREHILLANILDCLWSQDKSIDLAGLIQAIQSPPFDQIGVLDVEMFYPAKERFGLAMQLNNLLAAPGFETWLQGESLDIQQLLYTNEGKPCAAIFSISHLSDRERMFFVTMLLNELLGWMRTQAGTSSLRAMIYMDEIFGYLPPVANPPSKLPMLTLLKQARAFGVSMVLATQNPVDLDYKALSNMGTWFIGRLQTERDQSRVAEGLRSGSNGLEDENLETTLSSLGKRVFLLHNVHEDRPVIFQTRWTMAYLCGPLTRAQIKQLGSTVSEQSLSSKSINPQKTPTHQSPVTLPDDINVYYMPVTGQDVVYQPAVVLAVDVHYVSKTYGVEETRSMTLAVAIDEGPVMVNWDSVIDIPLAAADFATNPLEIANFGEIPAKAKQGTTFRKWQKDFLRYVRQHRSLTLYRSKTPKLFSQVDESKAEFLARLRQYHREKRDHALAKLRQRYGTKLKASENKLLRAEQTVERELLQARQQQMDSALAVGSTLLGAFMGRKSGTRAKRAVRTVSRLGQAQLYIQQAKEKANVLREDIVSLEAELQQELSALEVEYQLDNLVVEEIAIAPKSTNITQHLYGLLWLPYRQTQSEQLQPLW
ncbi:MAG: DUF87 domain-containing protein [Leptolyngbya sp. SIO3F4]|nr:DUF87 domain-containing protein [Leptolyngbya sp. SIO3F4]